MIADISGDARRNNPKSAEPNRSRKKTRPIDQNQRPTLNAQHPTLNSRDTHACWLLHWALDVERWALGVCFIQPPVSSGNSIPLIVILIPQWREKDLSKAE
jgi:hypothetical protein